GVSTWYATKSGKVIGIPPRLLPTRLKVSNTNLSIHERNVRSSTSFRLKLGKRILCLQGPNTHSRLQTSCDLRESPQLKTPRRAKVRSNFSSIRAPRGKNSSLS